MKSYLTVGLGVALLATMVFAGGCVSKDEYDRVMALNRNANAEIANLDQTLRALKAQNEQLQKDLLAARSGDNSAELARLRDENKSLRDRIAALLDQLKNTSVAAAPPALDPKLSDALEALAKKYGWYYDKKSGMVRLPSDLTFEKGSATVNDKAKAALKELAGIFNTPEAMPYGIFIAGHTDDIPIKTQATKEQHPNNWYLSVHRAVSVEEVLASAGVTQPRLAAMGFSEWRPIAPNAPGNKGNQLNRRVELWVLPKDRFQATGSVAAPTPPAMPTE